MPRAALLVSLLLVTGHSSLVAGDWPQFLGPTRDNNSAEVVPAWTAPPKVLWKQPIGPAHSSPVVANGVVYAFYQPKKQDADALAAFDATTGNKLWEKSYPRAEFNPPFGPGPRGTPTVDGDRVFTLGGTGVLASWDAKTGDLKWQVDTLKQFKAENLGFGVSASPLVALGKVFVNVGGKGAGVVAFDRETGKTAWQATDDGASYSSPILVRTGDKPQVVVLTKQHLLGLDPETGAVYWQYPFRDLLSESATAPLAVNGLLVGSSVTLGSVALKLGVADGKPTAERVWAKKSLNCYFSTPAAANGHLFMLNGVLGFTPSITLRCVDPASGAVTWEKPNVGKYHAALVRTGDNKLLMLSDTGKLTLFAADPAGYKELAVATVCGPTWAHPALADGRLVVRDETDLICVQLGK